MGIKPSISKTMIDKYTEDITVDGSLIQKELGFVPQFPSHVPTISLQEKRALPIIFLDNMSRKTDTEIKDEVKWLCIP